MPILEMRARLNVEPGTRVCYQPPSMSDSPEWNAFYDQYRCKFGTIVGFPTEFVGLGDQEGREPGEYYFPEEINVRFDGEEKIHTHLITGHCIILGPAVVAELKTPINAQRIGDLPQRIEYYPGDIVGGQYDSNEVHREVKGVSVDRRTGMITYWLIATLEDRRAHEKAHEQQVERLAAQGELPYVMPSFTCDIGRSADQLVMVRKGNEHFLHTDPSQMRFASPDEAIDFWGSDRHSKTVYTGSGMMRAGEFTLEQAQRMLHAGNGDLIVKLSGEELTIDIGKDPQYRVKTLHPRFASYAEHMRRLCLSVYPSAEKSRA